MSEWKEYKITDLANLYDHRRVPLSAMERDIRRGIYPYYGASGVIDYVEDYLFDGEFVLISEDGENLISRQTPIAFKVDGKFWVNNHAHVVKGSSPFLNDLIVFYFANLDLSPFLTGAVQPKLSQENLLSIPILLPESESEQRAIASILSSLDDKIDLLHRQNKTLEALAETLFRQWFVEEADRTSRANTIEELVTFDPRETLSGKVESSFFDMKCLSNNSMSLGSGIRRTVGSGSAFRNGDTLLAKITPCLENGKTGFVHHLEDNELARGSTEFIVMRPKEGISPYFVYCLARNSDFRNTAILSMTGTSGRQRVQTAILKNYEIRASNKVMQLFHDMCHPYFEKVRMNAIQIYALSQLRDTLLPKLMSGEIRLNCDLCD